MLRLFKSKIIYMASRLLFLLGEGGLTLSVHTDFSSLVLPAVTDQGP